jgi:hypothetical protein
MVREAMNHLKPSSRISAWSGAPGNAVRAEPGADATYPKDTHESLPSLLYDKHKPQVLCGRWWGLHL